jgi:hypothetical protein
LFQLSDHCHQPSDLLSRYDNPDPRSSAIIRVHQRQGFVFPMTRNYDDDDDFRWPDDPMARFPDFLRISVPPW